MKYRVVVEESARDDIDSIVTWIAASSEVIARAWYFHVKEALQSLALFPERCPHAQESGHRNTEIRKLLLGKGRGQIRILYTIKDDSVRVLHVRRSSRDFVSPEDLRLP